MTTLTSRAGIEDALLQVEIPRPVLLRHQPPLQPVGKPPDDALQVGELLVEKRPEPFELLLVAKLVGADRLVEGRGEDLVVDLLGQVGERVVGPPRLAGRLGVGVLVVGHFVGRGVGGVRLPGILVVGRGFGLLRARILVARLVLAALLALLLAFRLVVGGILRVLAVLFVAELLGHLHGHQHVADEASEGVLVVERLGEAGKIGAGLLLDPLPPQPDHALAALRHRAAGEPLAHHQRHRLLERRVGLVAHVGQIGLGVLVLQHRADVVGHPEHGARADRLDPGLLHRVEDRTRLLAFGRQLEV